MNANFLLINVNVSEMFYIFNGDCLFILATYCGYGQKG